MKLVQESRYSCGDQNLLVKVTGDLCVVDSSGLFPSCFFVMYQHFTQLITSSFLRLFIWLSDTLCIGSPSAFSSLSTLQVLPHFPHV